MMTGKEGDAIRDPLGLLSDFQEQHPDENPSAFSLLLSEHPGLAEKLLSFQHQWTATKNSEVVPIRGFNFWFPRRIGNYQILAPLSQTAEETVCLARHLENGQLLGLKLLAPGCDGKPEQLRSGIEKLVDFGHDQGIAYCSFCFGNAPVLATTGELIAAAAEVKQTPSPVPVAARVAPPRPFTNTPRMQDRFTRIVDRMRSIWKRPAFSKTSFGIVAIAAGALAFAGSAIPQRGTRPAPGEASMGSKPHGSGSYGSGLAFQELSLDQLDRSLAENPENAQASALRAILLAQQKSRLAWKDYEVVQRAVPNSFAAGFVEDLLENQLGPKPRMLPSSQESAAAKPCSVIDYSLLGLQSTLQRRSTPDAAFSK